MNIFFFFDPFTYFTFSVYILWWWFKMLYIQASKKKKIEWKQRKSEDEIRWKQLNKLTKMNFDVGAELKSKGKFYCIAWLGFAWLVLSCFLFWFIHMGIYNMNLNCFSLLFLLHFSRANFFLYMCAMRMYFGQYVLQRINQIEILQPFKREKLKFCITILKK